MTNRTFLLAVGVASALGSSAALWTASVSAAAAESAPSGPAGEKRFPPLKLPAGFKATLFACDPFIEYSSAIAAGPRAGSLFTAVDYMTGLGTAIVRRDEVRLLEDLDGDGYADKSTVFADGFNSIQGMTFHRGTVYVMHAPFLTALTDTDGDGKADQRRDLLSGLGLTPEDNPVRLHCANGIVAGHDGWLYLALGDNGCNVPRPEGDRLVLHGGGILRCRLDGRDLHVFARGLRNIYDVALDDDLNVFVRDNENDGGEYKNRVCWSFFGADHGYPYLYYERPDEALAPLVITGLGSSAGVVCYRETAFPPEYRGLFLCEWGRAVMRCKPEPTGSGFAPTKEIEFAAGADNDPYGFKPTDVIVQSDGALFVADWADGQRPLRGRGRIYRITHADGAKATAEPRPSGSRVTDRIAELDSPSAFVRLAAQEVLERAGPAATAELRDALRARRRGVVGRGHALWTLAVREKVKALDDLFAALDSDAEPRVQVQAARAIGDLTDPDFVAHRLDAGPGDARVAERLAAAAAGKDPRVVREIIVALGRLRWAELPARLNSLIGPNPDAAMAHAAMQALRRVGNVPATLKLLDEPDSPARAAAVRALAGNFDPAAADGIAQRLSAQRVAVRRSEYTDLLTRVHRKPGPWVYWGYRPPPRPANTVAWDRTEAIAAALDGALADPEPTVRTAVLRRMLREKIPTRAETLEKRLREETAGDALAAILEALHDHPPDTAAEALAALVPATRHTTANRLAALAAAVRGPAGERRLLEIAEKLEDGPVLTEALRLLGARPGVDAGALLLGKTASPEPIVRAAALEALAERKATNADAAVRRLLADPNMLVRRAAISAAGRLQIRDAIEAVLTAAGEGDTSVRRAALDSLRLLAEPRALPAATVALADADLRSAALQLIATVGGPAQARAVAETAERSPSPDVLSGVHDMLMRWGRNDPDADRAAARLQANTGVVVRWTAAGRVAAFDAVGLVQAVSAIDGAPAGGAAPTILIGVGAESRITLRPPKGSAPDRVWVLAADLDAAERADVQFLAAADGEWSVRLNGKVIHERTGARALRPDSERFAAVLERGRNRLVVRIAEVKGAAEFHLRFRRKSAAAEHERLMEAALTKAGNPERGRKLFLDAGRTQCVKCHRLGDQGEKIGPDLTGVGARFPRVYIVESILEPSRTIAPSFETVAVRLKDDRILTGVRVAETAELLTLADKEGKRTPIAKAEIAEQRAQPTSTMPDGLVKGLTADEFVDLIAFLARQR